LAIERQGDRINQKLDAATPQAKGHIVPAPGKRSRIDDFRTTRGFICLNIVFRRATLDDGRLVVTTSADVFVPTQRTFGMAKVECGMKSRTALLIE